MNESKANKIETENMLDAIMTLNRQVQHTIVILNEALKLNLVKGEDTKLAKEDRSLNLIKQAQVLTNWVIKADVRKRIDSRTSQQQDTMLDQIHSEDIELVNAKQALKLAMKDNQEIISNTNQGWRSPKLSLSRFA